MTSAVHVGAILIEDRPLMTRALNIDSAPYGCNWSVVQSLSGFDLDHKFHAAGWNFFFMAGELKTRFLGAVSQPSLHAALMRILARMRGENFNCLEVTGISGKHFLGVPYTVVSAHWRHIQQGCRLDPVEQRRTQQTAAEWARA
jgi:hypothetical protein